MQNDSSGGNPERLHSFDNTRGFPSHTLSILNPGKPIACQEILCRLLHVCMIETGFIPVIEEGELDGKLDEFCEATMWDSIPKLVRNLEQIIDKVGNLHNVNYKAIILESVETDGHSVGQVNGATSANESSSSSSSNANTKQKSNGADSGNIIPVTSKESGDANLELDELNDDANGVQSKISVQQVEMQKSYSENISVSIIHDGLTIYAVANGPGFHKNAQITLPQYIRPKSEPFPMSASMEDYLRLMTFSAVNFVNDMKRTFCYPIMDSINGLSYEMRSLCWFPAEIIVEIAKRCSPLQVFRLRATCWDIRSALSDANKQFWKMMLKRDFPQYNIENLSEDTSPDKYFKKYTDMSNFTLRRPFRRIEKDGKLPFLDVMVENVNGTLNVDVYRKPSSTMRLIPSDSFHDWKHKMAAYHSMAHFMVNLPLSDERVVEETSKIVKFGEVNGYRESTIMHVINKHRLKKSLRETTTLSVIGSSEPKKRVGIRFYPDVTKKLKSIYANHDLELVHRNDGSLRQLVGSIKDVPPDLQKSGIYSIQCNCCGRMYYGMTIRKLFIRFNEHVNSAGQKRKTAVGKHIFSAKHQIHISDLKLVQEVHRHWKIEYYEAIHIHKHKHENLLNANLGDISSPLLKLFSLKRIVDVNVIDITDDTPYMSSDDEYADCEQNEYSDMHQNDMRGENSLNIHEIYPNTELCMCCG